MGERGDCEGVVSLTSDPNDPELKIIDPENNQQMTYLVLSDEERAKGFVRPVRKTYIHVGNPKYDRKGCGGSTTMGTALAETYARDPKFYGGTFCAHCSNHYPVGAEGEFVWDGTEERVGT